MITAARSLQEPGCRRRPRSRRRSGPASRSLFNGKDLSGWRGGPGGGGVFSPYVEAKFTPEERAAKQAEWNADRDLHWSVDAATGELVSDGKGVHLATEKPYGDFEFRVDWKLTQPGGDSGIYLRRLSAGADLGSQQRPRQEERRRQGVRRAVEQQPRQPGPLAAGAGRQADRPVEHDAHQDGRHARVGDPQRHAVVVGQVLDNFFDRTQPVLPTGSIELQTHGSEVRFRNVYVREIPEKEGKALLAAVEVDRLTTPCAPGRKHSRAMTVQRPASCS